MTLKDIAIELLEKYESAELGVIWECSCNIDASEKALKKEISRYRKLISEADRNSSENPNSCETCRFDDRYEEESICSGCSRYYSDCYAPSCGEQKEK